jgi:hypothetical protein
MKEEIDELKKIVNDVFFVDLLENNRKRKVVDARRVYSKILRDRGYTFESIGQTLNLNHATILHYIKTIENIIAYDFDFKEKYISCKNDFLKDKKIIRPMKRKIDMDVYMSAIRLKNELDECILNKKELLNNFVNYIEDYEKTNNRIPGIYEIRNIIIPLFND